MDSIRNDDDDDDRQSFFFFFDFSRKTFASKKKVIELELGI